MDLPHSEKSAAEIAALPPLGTTQCMAHVRAHGGAYDAETLVYLLQQSLALHDTPFFELCGRLLIGSEGPDGRWHGGHCEGVIVNLARHFGFTADRELIREFRANCHGALWRAIHGGRPFWQARFGMAFRQKCIEVARSLIRPTVETAQGRGSRDSAGQEVPDVDNLADADRSLVDDEVLERLSDPAHEAVLLAAVRRLPSRQAAAVLLAWVESKRIEGAGAETVSSLMAITPRAVRMLLARARRTLQGDPAIRAIWFGEA
jgi:DNA-directed RNA polymerase specialized sigma24 family protein